MTDVSPRATGAATPHRYDVIVVGARCGGAPTAMLLARQGARVLLVDRAAFPSDSMRGHFLRGTAVDALARWGLLDQVVATGSPALATYLTDFGDGPMPTPVPLIDDGAPALCAPRRIVLDAILVEAAAAAGVEVRQTFTVEDLIWDDGVVTGIVGRARGGDTVREQAHLVVGADGMRSLVARRVDAPVYGNLPPLSCGYYGYFDGPPLDAFAVVIHPRQEGISSGHFAFAAPTNDGLVMAYVAVPIEHLAAFRSDLETMFFRTVNRVSWFADLMAGRNRVERWRGTGDLPNFFRRPYGPGWALVGDAGYHQDPVTARGIGDAFRDAEFLTEAIADGLSGRATMANALAGYERRRNEAARPGFEEAIHWAMFRPFPAEFLQQRAALRATAAA